MVFKSKSSPSLSCSAPYCAPAHDPFHLVLIICLILGCGTLLAYNALVSCATYFNHQFPDYPSIEFTIVPVFSIPNLVCIILMIPLGDRLSWNFKILGCFSILAVLVLSIPYISDPQWNIFGLSQSGGYYAFLAIVAVIGCLSAVLQCSITAFCGLLPVTYLQTVLAGQSVSGILVCVIRIGSKVLLPLTPQGIEKSGKLYFMVSAGVCIVCALSFYYARHSEFVQHHVSGLDAISSGGAPRSKRMHRARSVMSFSTGHGVPKSTARISLRSEFPMMCSPSPSDAERIEVFDAVQRALPSSKRVQSHPLDLECDSLVIPMFTADHCQSVFVAADDGMLAPLRTVTAVTALHSASDNVSYGAVGAPSRPLEDAVAAQSAMSLMPKYVGVFCKVRHLVGSIWLSMCFTFLWFPGMITAIPSSFAAINEHGEWMPLILILEFNVFDYIGRQFVCNVVPSWLTQHDLWKISLFRMASYPLFVVFCNEWLVSDFAVHSVMIVSALSNGYVASLSFMWFPQNVRKNEQQIAASLMTLGLILGILSGSTMALILRPYISP